MNLYEQLTPAEKAFHDALVGIVDKYGTFDKGASSVWVGYESAEDNDEKIIGVKCSNCSFHGEMQGEKLSCALLSYAVEPEGKCRLAAIPDGLVNAENDDMDDMEDNDDMDKFWKGKFIK